jgi:phosphate transport system protein
MINIEEHRTALNEIGKEMLNLCSKQLLKSVDSFITNDSDLAEEVINTENSVNAIDLIIERECEEFIAMFNPVAIDLRFVLALRKINLDLERIGDHAYGISNFVSNSELVINESLLEKVNFNSMVTIIKVMFENIEIAYNDENLKVARKVFKLDKKVDKINEASFNIISNEIRNNVEITEQALLLFSVIKKFERVGGLLKNIAEEIIFYHEAKLIKHKRKKK